MRLCRFLAVFLLAAPTLLLSQNPGPKPSQDESKAIEHIEKDLNDERVDADMFERVAADDYVNLVPRGLGPGKREIIANLRKHHGQALPYTTEIENMHIYILGDTAVAAFTKVYTAKENGKIAREDTTHIFRKEGGNWRLKISRATLQGIDLE